MTRPGPDVAVIRWEEPPPSRRVAVQTSGSSRHSALAQQLRDNPGRWALVYEGTPQHAGALTGAIRQAHRRCFEPLGHFDAVCRHQTRHGTKTARVYARYLGDGEGGEHRA